MAARKLNSLFVNPYILNGVVWLVVLLVYQLNWSSLCPPLSTEMSIFMAVSIAVSFLVGTITYYRGAISFYAIRSISIRSLWLWTGFLELLFMAEVAAARGFPLITYAMGGLDLSYKEFGLPFVHVAVVNGLTCTAIYAYYALRSFKYLRNHPDHEPHPQDTKKNRRQLWWVIIASLIPFVMMFNRGGAMSIIIGMFLLVLLTCRRPGKMSLGIGMSFLVIFFVFGWLGNMRMGEKFDNLILKVGKATKSFQDSGIPQEFFWGYLYIATPLANAQNTVNHTGEIVPDSEELEDMILYEFTPELITKRIKGENSKTFRTHRSVLLTDDLTATSVYGRVYKYLGWGGMWLMFVFILGFIYLNMHLVSRRSKWFVPTLVVIDVIVVMNLFDNMFIFMGMIPQLFIFLGAYWIGLYTRHTKKMVLK